MIPKSNAQERTRFVVYTRYSSEAQNELSLEAQERLCREAIALRGGVVTGVFSDSAKTGWSLNRDGFIDMRRMAEKGQFDAIMFWKFDRLARDHNHVVMIKALLRHEYGVKLYCVEGFSEDDDNSPYTAMMEQLLAVISAFYSKNLSSETKRGKQQRAVNGDFNGSTPPLGYDLVLTSHGTEERPSGLYVNPKQAAIVIEAFERYVTGKYSDAVMAEWLNSHELIQEFRAGKKPIGKETVRDLLQNQVYTGRVPYAETEYRGTLGQGKKSNRHRKIWYEGKHEGIISDELFEECQKVRERMSRIRQAPSVSHTYVLHGKVYCARCMAVRPLDINDVNYGKMRPGWNNRADFGQYRCLARDRGYNKCGQIYVRAEDLDEQVAFELSHLTIPDGFRQRVEEAVQNRVENADALQRMEELTEVVKRINFSWENGLITPEEYLEKRHKLQREIESLRPVDYDDLMNAADLLENFQSYWKQCETVDDPLDARRQLIDQIVDKVFVYDDKVVAITLHGDFGVILDQALDTPDEIIKYLEGESKSASLSTCTQNGIDGT